MHTRSNQMTAPVWRARSRLPVAIAVLAGCVDAGAPEIPACGGPVAMSLSAGPAPQFDWTPACKVHSLVVTVAGDAAEVWAIVTDNTNEISPGVRYGTVPPGVREQEDPDALVVGVTYHVAVRRWTGSGLEVIGVRAFTPWPFRSRHSGSSPLVDEPFGR